MDKLIITKSLRSGYKNPKQIAHKVLADRIGKRDPGNAPSVGDRIAFVYIHNKNKKALQSAEAAKPIKTKAKRQQKLERIAKLWHHLKAKMGANAMRKDTNAAQAIHVEAAKHRYPELLIKETSEVIGPEAIRRLLSELRELDKVG